MNAQEQFWAGPFGNDYNRRSPGDVRSNVKFFHRAFQAIRHQTLDSILELGAGTGANLKALAMVRPYAERSAVEINTAAADAIARDCPEVRLHRASILGWTPPERYDLVLTKGVLIHIAPEYLAAVYALIHHAAQRYILIAEYYNPSPVEVPYRGHAGRLWKRDFAGELLNYYDDLRLIGYGFVYHRDEFPQDDLNWFLIEKRGEHAERSRAGVAA